MATTLAALITDMSSFVDSIVPLDFVGLVAGLGAVVGAGAMAVKRLSKSLR